MADGRRRTFTLIATIPSARLSDRVDAPYAPRRERLVPAGAVAPHAAALDLDDDHAQAQAGDDPVALGEQAGQRLEGHGQGQRNPGPVRASDAQRVPAADDASRDRDVELTLDRRLLTIAEQDVDRLRPRL